jgi:hypothetical protein
MASQLHSNVFGMFPGFLSETLPPERRQMPEISWKQIASNGRGGGRIEPLSGIGVENG